MEFEFKAVPFIQTSMNENYYKFISQPFTIEYISQTNEDSLIQPLFDGWKVSDMIGWHKFYNRYDQIIEFYGQNIPYKIINPVLQHNQNFIFPYPKNIEEFICDCHRCSVTLYWSEFTLSKVSKKYLLPKDKIETYINLLLQKLDKLED